jgi:hypothetical protein
MHLSLPRFCVVLPLRTMYLPWKITCDFFLVNKIFCGRHLALCRCNNYCGGSRSRFQDLSPEYCDADLHYNLACGATAGILHRAFRHSVSIALVMAIPFGFIWRAGVSSSEDY